MLSAGVSPSTSSPTGNYGLTKIAVAQVSVLLSTLKTKKDDPVEYENRLERLKKVRYTHSIYPPNLPMAMPLSCRIHPLGWRLFYVRLMLTPYAIV